MTVKMRKTKMTMMMIMVRQRKDQVQRSEGCEEARKGASQVANLVPTSAAIALYSMLEEGLKAARSDQSSEINLCVMAMTKIKLYRKLIWSMYLI